MWKNEIEHSKLLMEEEDLFKKHKFRKIWDVLLGEREHSAWFFIHIVYTGYKSISVSELRLQPHSHK